MMYVLFLLACEAESERQCFIEYVKAYENTTDDAMQCFERADNDDDVEECSDDWSDDGDEVRDDAEACAGEGCLADWLDCTDHADDERDSRECYRDLEECGGWIDADAAIDCNDEANDCADEADDFDDLERCTHSAYGCMIDAAGGD